MARMGRRTSAHGQKSDNPTHEYKSFVFQLEDANEENSQATPPFSAMSIAAGT